MLKTLFYSFCFLLVSSFSNVFAGRNQELLDHICASNKTPFVALKDLIKEEKIDIDAKDENHDTLLMLAVKKGKLEVATALITAGANVNLPAEHGLAPIHIAALNGFLKILEELISSNADVDMRANNGCSALFLATEKREKECVTALIKARANVNLPTKRGLTPIHVAASEGSLKILEELISSNADLSLECSHLTALLMAASNGHVECVKLLAENGANIQARNEEGNTALHLAANDFSLALLPDKQTHKHIECMLFLNNSKLDWNMQNNNGETVHSIFLQRINIAIRKIERRNLEHYPTEYQQLLMGLLDQLKTLSLQLQEVECVKNSPWTFNLEGLMHKLNDLSLYSLDE